MKFNILLLLFICLTACKSQSNLTTIEKPIIQTTSKCLEGYTCEIALLPNKSVVFKPDQFNSVYASESSGNGMLLKFELQKIENPKLPDGRYSEIIYAEIPSETEELTLKDGELQQIKLHAAKFCFCENANTYVPITTGSFHFKKMTNNQIAIQLDFKLKKQSRKVTSLNEVILVK